MKASLLLSLAFASTFAWAQKAGVKVSDIPTSGDTSIVIKKGVVNTTLVPDYDVITDKDEIFGDPSTNRSEAYTSWKSACQEWRKEMRDMNKENQILTLNCNSPTLQKDEYIYTFKSMGTFKIRVRIRDKK